MIYVAKFVILMSQMTLLVGKYEGGLYERHRKYFRGQVEKDGFA